MRWNCCWILCLVLAAECVWAETPGDACDIIPAPTVFQRAAGNLVLRAGVPIQYDTPEWRTAADLLAAALKAFYGLQAAVSESANPAEEGIFLSGKLTNPALGPEGYTLEVNPKQALIRASKPAGAFYATQSLLQLLPLPANGARPESLALPCVSIQDQPRFGWRGLMLDCSRTFLSMDYLRRSIDRLGYYKMNILHLHLTDDQGWRMQIKKHPRLTEVGAYFDPRIKGEISGFYTQDELRALVRYAADRNVTLVPEIEMPSHCLAALTAYPDLSCRGDAYNVVPYMPAADPVVPTPPYGVFCAGNDRTFAVLEDVLAEVIDVFPCQYIHIGGDECPKEFWKSCPKCQARMKAENLANENELQSYFVKRIEKCINAKGRTLLGWDEILEGGLAPNATVMSWRGINGGIEAARAGHDTTMSPTTHCYFDYDYLTTPLRKTYEYEPIPAELTPEQSRHVLGAQGNMWTHLARNERNIDGQIYPRLIALAEATWSPKERRNWNDFERRMNAHNARLDAMKVGHYVERPVPALAVSPDGTPWVVVGQQAYAYDVKAHAWKKQPGAITQIAHARDGRRYALGTEPKPGGYPLLEWVDGAWKPASSGGVGVSLSIDAQGDLWLITDAHALLKRDANAWCEVPGPVVRLAHGPKGERYALSSATLAGGYDIVEWTGGGWRSLGAGAAAVEIAVTPDGVLWAVNSLGVTFARREGVWTAIPGMTQTLCAVAGGGLFGIGQNPGDQHFRLMQIPAPGVKPEGFSKIRWTPVEDNTVPAE